jgi:hypothetical protein
MMKAIMDNDYLMLQLITKDILMHHNVGNMGGSLSQPANLVECGPYIDTHNSVVICFFGEE